MGVRHEPSGAGDPVGLDDLAPSAGAAVGEITGRWSALTWVRRLAMVIFLGVAVSVLLLNVKKSESAATAIAHARPGWVAAVVLSTIATYALAAGCTLGSTSIRLNPSKTVVMQVASSFVNRFVPGGVGGAVLNVRFVEQAGARRTAAITANVLNAAAGLAAHLAIFLAFVPLFGGVHRDIDAPDDSAVFAAVLVGLIGIGEAAWIRWIPRHWKGHLAVMRQATAEALTSPRRVVLLLGGSAGQTLAHGVGLWCALRAVGAPVTFADVMIVYLVAGAAGAISPTPGGLGAIEVALVAGLTQTGTLATSTSAAVLVYRIVSYWLPVIPGFVAFRWLRRTGAV
jgi:undecaprenyl-diphosphatase